MTSEVQKTILQTINSKELETARFLFFTEGENVLHLKKGKRTLTITYFPEHDLYNLRVLHLRKNSETTIDQEHHRVFAEELKGYIEHIFGFEYVMEGIINGERR